MMPHNSYLIFLLSLVQMFCLSVLLPPSSQQLHVGLFISTGSLTQFLHHLPRIFIYFSHLHPGANEFWMWSVWGPQLLPCCCLSSWVLPWCTKCLSWILNKPQDPLRASWSTALLLPSYYSARGLGAPAGWMGFESVVLLVKVEIFR